MKWVWIGLGVLALLVLIVVVIGLLLPRSHRATRMARFKQPPGKLFALVSGPQDWRGVTRTPLGPDGSTPRWRETWGHQAITFEQKACEPPRLFASQIADKDLPFSGTWTWEITPSGDGCVCRITEEGQIPNPIFRFVSRFVIGQSSSIEQYLQAMGKQLNEPVKIEP